jgi:hypothetical protein
VEWYEHGSAEPVQEPIDVAFHAQPDNDSQVACAAFVVHATDVPLHEPIVVASQMQPGVVGHVVEEARVAQLVTAGVPTQRGPVEKVRVDTGARMSADLQQIWLLQSLLCLHVLGHDVLQTPLQQTSPAIVSQSVDCAHFVGQGVDVVFRQSPSTARWGSSKRTEVQQTSLLSVLQSVETVHDLGHCSGGRQMASL